MTVGENQIALSCKGHQNFENEADMFMLDWGMVNLVFTPVEDYKWKGACLYFVILFWEN